MGRLSLLVQLSLILVMVMVGFPVSALTSDEWKKDGDTSNNQSIEINQENAELWDNKGLALADLGKYDEAIEAYNQGIKIDPNYTNLWINKGWALSILGKYDEAIEVYDQGIKIDPKSAYAWFSKGNIIRELGKYDEAIEAYDQVLEINPDFPDVNTNREIALSSLKK